MEVYKIIKDNIDGGVRNRWEGVKQEGDFFLETLIYFKILKTNEYMNIFLIKLLN